ncbi:hypothetical protein E4U28_007871 [Claviceps purpurea]|nr:hypothetical protein E4U28_007871 [Claviceps purpurea]
MDHRHRFDPPDETNKEKRPSTAPIQATLFEADVPKRLRKFVKRGFFSARWKRAHDDINHGTASTIDANDRVAFFIRDSIDEGLTDMDLGNRFRDDFGSWGEKSFDLLSSAVQSELRDFLRERGALSDYGFQRKIVPFLAEVVRTESPEETKWRQLMAIHHERQRQRSRQISSFPIHIQQARPAPGVDLQLSHTHRQQQLLPTVIRSLIPPTYEKKNLPVLHEPPLQYCPVPTQPQPVPQEKLLSPQLLHETPISTPRTEIRPNPLHQDTADSHRVKTTAGSHKLESAAVDKTVNDSVKNTLAEHRHGTSGDNEEEHPSDPSKSAAASPSDDITPTIPAADPRVEPEQCTDEPLDKGTPPDGQDFAAAHYEDPADVEDSDGSIDDRKRNEKEKLREEFSPAIYIFSPDKGSSWMPPALKLLMTPPAPKCLMTTMTLVNHFLAEFENYFRLVERLVP